MALLYCPVSCRRLGQLPKIELLLDLHMPLSSVYKLVSADGTGIVIRKCQQEESADMT